MFENKTEQEARKEILEMVKAYHDAYHNKHKEFKEGDRITYASRVYDSQEMVNLVDASLEFWLTAGKYFDEFEREFAKQFGTKFVSLVNSGSSANLLAFMTLTSPLLGERQVKRGDEVITVACGFPTTVTPMIQYGAIPVFVDVTIPQYNIDVNMLEEALSPKTKVVMIAHTLGNPFDLESVVEFCKKHNLWLIEDNCDALGSTYTIKGEKKFTGTIGDIGTSSFYPPHHMTMGEGGAVYTSNPLLSRIMKSIRDWGRDCICHSGQDNMCGHRFDRQYGELPVGYDHKYVYSHFGYNLKPTDLQAAVGVAQLKKFPDFVQKRKENYKRLYEALKPVEDKPNYRFVKGDIADRKFVFELFEKERPDVVINFAAESHVDRSISDPESFVRTNVLGTTTLMDAAREFKVKRYHQVSTDEVYGDLPLDRPDLFFTEETPLHTSSPYSSSKAAADLFVLAYHRTYGLPVTISRCSNNYGPYHFPEKLIPLIISRALASEELPVYGKGENVRDWLHVKDHCSAIDLIVRKGKVGEVYNVGGHNERTNLEVVKTILKVLDKPESLIRFVSDRPGHDMRYAIDPTKIENELGWKPEYNFDTGIVQTIEWYLNNREWWEHIVSGEYTKYFEEMYADRLDS